MHLTRLSLFFTSGYPLSWEQQVLQVLRAKPQLHTRRHRLQSPFLIQSRSRRTRSSTCSAPWLKCWGCRSRRFLRVIASCMKYMQVCHVPAVFVFLRAMQRAGCRGRNVQSQHICRWGCSALFKGNACGAQILARRTCCISAAASRGVDISSRYVMCDA